MNGSETVVKIVELWKYCHILQSLLNSASILMWWYFFKFEVPSMRPENLEYILLVKALPGYKALLRKLRNPARFYNCSTLADFFPLSRFSRLRAFLLFSSGIVIILSLPFRSIPRKVIQSHGHTVLSVAIGTATSLHVCKNISIKILHFLTIVWMKRKSSRYTVVLRGILVLNSTRYFNAWLNL